VAVVNALAPGSDSFASVSVFRRPHFRHYWHEQNARAGFDDDFVAFLEAHIETAPLEDQNWDEPITD